MAGNPNDIGDNHATLYPILMEPSSGFFDGIIYNRIAVVRYDTSDGSVYIGAYYNAVLKRAVKIDYNTHIDWDIQISDETLLTESGEILLTQGGEDLLI